MEIYAQDREREPRCIVSARFMQIIPPVTLSRTTQPTEGSPAACHLRPDSHRSASTSGYRSKKNAGALLIHYKSLQILRPGDAR